MQVVDVPEKIGVAMVRSLVVSYRTVWSRVLADAQNAGSLADVCITHQHLLPKLLPSAGLIPSTMLKRLVSLTMALRFRFLSSCWSCWRKATSYRLQPWLEGCELAHTLNEKRRPEGRLCRHSTGVKST